MRLLAVTLALSMFADVMPSCGRREPRMATAGQSCGGPSVCVEDLTCATLDQSISMPGWSSSYVCTKACASDADCASLSTPMRCTGMGWLAGYSRPSERVCIPESAEAGAP